MVSLFCVTEVWYVDTLILTLEQPIYRVELNDKNILSNINGNAFFLFRSSRGGFYFFVGKKVNKKPCPLSLLR